MKKMSIISILLAVSMICNAQFSVFSGLSLSEFWHDHDPDIMYKAGFDGGISDRIFLGRRLSLEPSLRYHVKGTLINKDRPWSEERFRMNLAYLELPIVLNVHLSKTIAIHGGGYAAYLLRMNNNKWDQAEVVRYNPNYFNRYDYGPAFGFSLDLHGAYLSFDGFYGLNMVADAGKALGRWYGDDGNGERLHPGFKNRSLSAILKIPVSVHKYR